MDIDKDTIREHCKRVAAQIIHDTMECEEPRAGHDWNAACRIVSEGLVDAAVRCIVEHCRYVNRDADPNHFGTFIYACRRMIWENLQGPRERMENKPPYGKITFH
jgi:hypothetical protein